MFFYVFYSKINVFIIYGFRARAIHFHGYLHCMTSVNTIMHKPEVVITQKRKQISTRSQGLIQCFGAFQARLRSNRRRPTSENSVTCELPVWGTVSTSGFDLMLFSEVGYCRRAL